MPANLDPTIVREEMEEKLKEVISQARSTGALFTIDWDQMTLPQVLIRNEREAALRQRPIEQSTLTAPPESSHSSASKKRKSSDCADDEPLSPKPQWNLTNMHRMSLENRVQPAVPDKRASPNPPAPKISKFQKQ